MWGPGTAVGLSSFVQSALKVERRFFTQLFKFSYYVEAIHFGFFFFLS